MIDAYFAEDYRDLARDVIGAGHRNYADKLAAWLRLIDDDQVAAPIVARLVEGLNFEAWYHRTVNVGGRIGSGQIDWAADRTERMAQQLALFRHFASNPDEVRGFAFHFTRSGNSFDAAINKLSRSSSTHFNAIS